jgi:hypothetical protein
MYVCVVPLSKVMAQNSALWMQISILTCSGTRWTRHRQHTYDNPFLKSLTRELCTSRLVRISAIGLVITLMELLSRVIQVLEFSLYFLLLDSFYKL